MSPKDFRWKNVEGKLEPNWFTGNQLQGAYEDIVISPDILGHTPESRFKYVFIALITSESK